MLHRADSRVKLKFHMVTKLRSGLYNYKPLKTCN